MARKGRVGLAESFKGKTKQQIKAEYDQAMVEARQRSSGDSSLRSDIGGKSKVLRAPASRGGINRSSNAIIVNNVDMMVITHREPFTTIPLTVGGVLNYQRVAIAPLIFPYLNGLASNYSMYKWVKLHFYYVPSCSTSTEGEIALGLVYDRQDASSASFTQVATMTGGVSSTPWGGGPRYGSEAISVTTNCNLFPLKYYNYMAAAAFSALSLSDQNSYCPVSLCAASQGSTDAVALAGRVWCEYKVELVHHITPGINA